VQVLLSMHGRGLQAASGLNSLAGLSSARRKPDVGNRAARLETLSNVGINQAFRHRTDRDFRGLLSVFS
jgi:hypothetical protein